jgi:AraC-like DNA-binding protein
MREVLEIVFLLAAVQGALLAVVLFARKQNHSANIILAIAMVCLSIDLLSAFYYTRGLYRVYPHFVGITYPFPFLYGPLFYLYVGLVSKKADRIHKTDLLHFLPLLITYVLCIPEFLYSGEQKIEFLKNMMSGIRSPLFLVVEYILPVQGMLYAFFTFKIVKEYDRTIRNAFSNIDLINLNWLKYIAGVLCTIWSIVTLLIFVRILTPAFNGLVQVSISLIIYSIGYKGLRQPEIFLNPSAASPESHQSEKYKRSGLNDRLAAEIGKKLTDCMSAEKVYLDDGLTLQKLAERLGISIHNLSEVINSRLNLSYYDFINNYRVEEFKKRIADPANDRFNILSVALDSGFKSKGTFNSIFKKNTGMTPSEYKSKVRKPEQ